MANLCMVQVFKKGSAMSTRECRVPSPAASSTVAAGIRLSRTMPARAWGVTSSESGPPAGWCRRAVECGGSGVTFKIETRWWTPQCWNWWPTAWTGRNTTAGMPPPKPICGWRVSRKMPALTGLKISIWLGVQICRAEWGVRWIQVSRGLEIRDVSIATGTIR